jgi:hypothetical protein
VLLTQKVGMLDQALRCAHAERAHWSVQSQQVLRYTTQEKPHAYRMLRAATLLLSRITFLALKHLSLAFTTLVLSGTNQ